MPTLFAKKKNNDKQLDHKSADITKKAEQVQNEMKKPENAKNSPGIFTKFVNWVKSVFSKEPNLEPGATAEGNVNAQAAQANQNDVQDTLSPEKTGAGVPLDGIVLELPKTDDTQAADMSSETNAVVQNAMRELSSANSSFEADKAADGESAASEEKADVEEESAAEEKEPEFTPGKNYTEDEAETAQIDKRITIGNMNLDVYQLEGYTFTQFGTLQVFGATVWWTADKKINLTTEDGKNYFGSGLIRFTAEDLSYKGKNELEAEFILQNNMPAYYFKEGLCYTRDGIMVNVGDWIVDLNEITATEVPLFNYSMDGESPMIGKITVDGSGLKGSAQKDIVWFPTALFKGVTDAPKLRLGSDKENKLGFSLSNDDLKVSFGIDNVITLSSTEPVTVSVQEDGKITYHLTDKYSVNLLNGLYEGTPTLTAIDVTMDMGMPEISVPEFDFDAGGVEVSGVSMKVSAEKGGGIKVKKLTYKDLTIEGLEGGFDESGIKAGSEKFELTLADKTFTGSLHGFRWNPGEGISVEKFALAVNEVSFGEKFTLNGASMEFSLQNGEYTFKAEGGLSVTDFRAGCVAVNAEDIKAEISYGQKKNDDSGEKGFSVSFGGSVSVIVGGHNPIAEATAENFSYENGKFEVETLTMKTGFDKLISKEFSGNAAITAENLKFSKDGVELEQLKLGIENLARGGETLVSGAEAWLIFKEGKEDEKKTKLDENAKLEMGENPAILTNGRLSIYLLENKKGAEITADGLNYAFEHLQMSFTDIKAAFFYKGGSNEISAVKAVINSGKALNELLGIEGLSLAASNCKITSAGLSLGEVSTEVKSLTIANALTLTDLSLGMEFGENMAFRMFEIKSSAVVGNIGIEGLKLTISKDGGNASAALEVKKISGGEELNGLEIADIKDGRYSKEGVTIGGAKAGFKLAGTDVSGSLTNLSWSKENNFSVEEITAKLGNIKLSDGLDLTGASITASIKDKSFSIGTTASLHISETKEGVIKVSETELVFQLDLSSVKDEEGASKLSVGGSASGKIKVSIGDDIASAEIENIKYKDGEFSVDRFEAEADLSGFGAGSKLGGSGKFLVNALRIQKDKAPTADSMSLNVSDLSYNGKALVNNISVNIILNGASGGEEGTKVGEAGLALDNGIDGELSGLIVSVFLTDQFKGVTLGAEKFGVAAGDFKFDLNKFNGRFGSENGGAVCEMQFDSFSMNSDFSDNNSITNAVGIKDLTFTAENVSVKDNKFNVGKISAEAKGDIDVCGFQISRVSVNTEFDDKWGLENLTVGGDLAGGDILASEVSASFSAKKKEGGISVKKLTYKKLTIENLSGKVSEEGISADADKFEFPIGDQTLSGSLKGFKWKSGESFSVSEFALSIDKLSLGENISLAAAKMEFSLKDGDFSFKAAGTLSVKEFNTAFLMVKTDKLTVDLSLAQGGSKDGGEKDEKTGLTVKLGGKINVIIGGEKSIAEAEAEDISYKDGTFGVGAVTLQTTFSNLISENFSGNATLTATGLKFSKTADLDSLGLKIEKLAYNKKVLISDAKAEIIIKEKDGEKTAAIEDGAGLDTGGDIGILNDAKISIYLTGNKNGAVITADSIGYSFNYFKADLKTLKAGFFTKGGTNEISAASAEIKTADKLNEFLGIKGLSIAASDCKISSSGLELGKVNAGLNDLSIANALNLSALTVEAEFGKKMAIKSFEMKSSAALGEFSVSGLVLKLSGDGEKFSAALEAAKIECGKNMKSLEITGAKGSYGEGGVQIGSAQFSFRIAGKDVSGSLKNLTWSNENNFSVEELKVSSGGIKISDKLELSSTEITASVKDKGFTVSAMAALHIDDIQKGVVKIDKTDLGLEVKLSDENDESKLSASGSVIGSVNVTFGDDIASAKVGEIKYKDDEFSVGEFKMDADLSKFGYEKLGGKGAFSVTDLKFGGEEKLSVGAMGLAVSGLTYNGKTLMSDLSVNIILDEKSGSKDAAKSDKADLSLDDGVKGELSALNVSVFLTDSFKGVKMDADSFSITPGNFEFNFDSFSGEFGLKDGSRVCNMTLGGMTVKSDFKENKIAQAIGIEALEFAAEDVSVKDNKFTVGRISAKVASNINIGGFTITGAEADAKFEGTKLKSMTLTGGLKYKEYFSGIASVMIDENGEMSFGEAKELKAKYGCFEGKADSIQKNGEILNLNGLTLTKTSKEAGDEFEYDGSLVSKLLQAVPSIEIGIKKLTFENGVLKRPSLDEISISKIEEDFKIGELISGKIGYTGGEKGNFTVDVNSNFSVPEGGYEKAARIPIITFPLTIIPVLLQGEFSLGFVAGATANFSFRAEAQRSEKAVNFNSEVAAKVQAKLGVYASAMLTASIVIAKAEAGLVMSAGLDSGVDLTGSFGITYDPNGESFFKSFNVNKEQTKLNYALNGDLDFKLDVTAGIKGFPMIFHDKTLSHSWNLFNYKLGGVKLNGSLTYNQAKDKYEFKGGKPEFTYGGSAKYDPGKTEDKIGELGGSLKELQNGMKKIDDMLKRAKGGINADKGSVDGVAGGENDSLGGEVDAAKNALMPKLRQRIDDVFKKSRKNSLKCHILMVDLTKMIDENADKLTENQRNVEALERIMGESRTALEITGFKAGSEFTVDKYREYIEELKKLKTDEERLDKLSELEPAAVVNMFKAFKLGKTKSWENIHDQAEDLTAEQTVNDVPEAEYKSQIKPGVYTTAMNELDSMLKKRQEELKKAEADAAESEKKVNGLDEKLKKMDTDGMAEINEMIKDNVRIYLDIIKTKETPISDEEHDSLYRAADEIITNDFLTDAGKERINEERALWKYSETSKKYKDGMAAIKKKYLKKLENRHTEMAKEIQARQMKHAADKVQLQKDLKTARGEHSTNTAALDRLKQQMMESGDVSTAMKVFQEFVSTEYKRTTGNLDKAQKKYGLTPKTEQPFEKSSPKISVEEKQKRKENVLSVIDRLIGDATDDNLKSFDSSRHTERLKTLQDQSGIVDVNMRGFGLPEHRKSNIAFNTMREDNKKFQSMQTQLDETYKQMTDFHEVIRQVLVSWQEVNGIKFGEKKTASEFAEGSAKVVDLIGEIDQAEKQQISEATLKKITDEVKTLTPAEAQAAAGQAAAANLQDEARRLGVE